MKWKMLRKKQHGFIALCLSVSVLLGGCGAQNPPAPELLEPVLGNESYRAVERGDVGALKLYYGTVVPEEYAHFWTTAVDVKELSVDIGDHVSAGQVLAVADIESAKEQVESLQASLNLENSVFQLEEQKYTLKREELELKQQGEAAVGDQESANLTGTELATLDENHRYDTLMHNHRVANINEQIEENQKIVTDGTLVAQTSGYVTFVRDISTNANVTSKDNVVVIADYDKTYIRLNDVNIDKDILSLCTDCYTFQNGQRYNLEDYRYSPETYLVAQSTELYPAQRLRFADGKGMGSVGSIVPVFLSNQPGKDVLRVGNDSLYQDDQGTFVYVKNGDSKEMRYIEIGKSDESYSEVLSGLEEGEKVFYVSEAVMPTNYEEYTVEMGNYDAKSFTDFYTVEESAKKSFYSEYEGQVVAVSKNEGDMVAEGDLIATIQTNEGSARLAEMRLGLEDMKEGHEAQQAAYSEQIKELEQKRNASVIPPVEVTTETEVATETDALPETDALSETGALPEERATDTDAAYVNPNETAMLERQIKQLELDKKLEEINYNYEYGVQQENYQKVSCNNDGTGVMYLYAKASGKISALQLQEGKKIELSTKMFNIEVPRKKKMTIQLNKQVNLGTAITFVDDETGKQYTGTICGEKGKLDPANIYSTSVGDRTYLTTNDSSGKRCYYVELSDESIFEQENRMVASYSSAYISGVVVIPEDMLYIEEGVQVKEPDRYYVWKVVDGDLQKQYVTAEKYTTEQDVIDPVAGKISTVACVLNGLSEGDILAREVTETEVEE